MPFHPPHFHLVENGFLLTVETPSLVISADDTDASHSVGYQYAVRKHFINHLETDGFSARDMAICCDGSDGQIWFEYSPDIVLQREVITKKVFDAVTFWNALKIKPFLPPQLVRVGFAPNPIFDLQPVSFV